MVRWRFLYLLWIIFFPVTLADVLHPSNDQLGSSRFIFFLWSLFLPDNIFPLCLVLLLLSSLVLICLAFVLSHALFTSKVLLQVQSSKALTPWRVILKSYMSLRVYKCSVFLVFLCSCLFSVFSSFCFKSFPFLHNILWLPIRSSFRFEVVSL